MNKAAIIGIAVAIIVGIVGIYAVSTNLDESPAGEASMGIGDEVGVTIEEEEGTAKVPTEEEEFGLEDEATIEIEEPEEEPEEIDINVKESFGIEASP